MDVDPIREAERIEPSPQFAARVMAAVRKEAMQPLPIPFPWRRVAIGAVLGIGVSAVFASSSAVTSRTESAWASLASTVDAIDPVFVGALTGVLLFSLATVQFALWLARRAA
jgi:hypothetical protein